MFHKKYNQILNHNLEQNKFIEQNELQQLIIPKINSGGDLIIESADKTGKTTALVISTIHKLQRPFEDAARALIIAPTVEHVIALEEQFKLLAEGTNLRIHMAHEKGKIDKQNEDIYFGADIVIGTPKRIMEIYFRKNINITKVKLFAIDDTEILVKNQDQGHIHRLTDSLPKCQKLIFTTQFSERVETMIEKFMVAPQIINL